MQFPFRNHVLFRNLYLGGLFFVVLGCSTSRHQRLEQLTTGMEKEEILDKIGSPNLSEFRFGKHEWIYFYYKDDIKMAKKLWLENKTLVKIEDLKIEADGNPSGSNVSEPKTEFKPEEIRKIKKTLQKNRRRQKYDAGFEDIN